MFKMRLLHYPFKAVTLILCLLVTAIIVQPAVSASEQAQPVSMAGRENQAQPAAPNIPDLDLPLPNITVDTATITNNSPQEDGKCDLWEALQAVFQANYGLSPTYHECTAKVDDRNIIAFSPSLMGSLITLPASGSAADLPFIWGDTVIVGPIGIRGAEGSDTRIFRLAPDAKLMLVAVSLKDTHASGCGPAIFDNNGASITLVGSFLINNDSDSDGGAICSNGDLNLIGTSFIGNVANGSPGKGGAVYISGVGSFKSEASTFTGNKASAGGAIYLQKSGGDASVSESIFTGNVVTGDNNDLGGGAIYNYSGILTIQRTAFNANIGLQGQGGAIVNNINATAAITNTIFDANIAGDIGYNMDGGAIRNLGTLRLSKSTLLANLTQGGNGGAIATSGNSQVSIANTTFSTNYASGKGGALYITGNSLVAMRNSTISDNSAGSANNSIFTQNTTSVSIGNTIINASASPQCDNAGITSLGHNIDWDGTCVTSGTDLQADPKLLDLDFNGGSLPVLTTYMPSSASPAVDAGDNNICADAAVGNEDETGATRPKDANDDGTGQCDIGAVEAPAKAPKYDAMPLPPGPLNFGNVKVGTSLPLSFNAKNVGSAKLTLTNPAVGDTTHFAITAFPAEINPGQQSPITLSCNPDAATPLASTLTFTTNDEDRLNVSYDILCTGAAAGQPVFASNPALPAPIDIGDVEVGQTKTRPFTISNIGTASLSISNLTYNGSPDMDPNVVPLQFALAAGASLTFQPSCAPTDAGLRRGFLQMTTNDPTQPQVKFFLTCTGTVPDQANLNKTVDLKSPNLPSDFTNPAGVAISHDSQNAYVVGMVDGLAQGQIVVLKRGKLGSTNVESFSWTTRDKRTVLYNNGAVAVSPDDKYVLATGITNKALVFYQRDSGTGDLTYLGVAQNGSGGVLGLDQPTDLAFSPDGKFVYVASFASNAIAIFKQDDTAANKFTFLGTMTNTTDNANHPLTKPRGIAVSPDGKNVYVAAYTNDPVNTGTLAVYTRNLIDGSLKPLQTRWKGDTQDCTMICFGLVGLNGAHDITVSPDGASVYVTGFNFDSLVSFSRDPVTGAVHHGSVFINTGLTGATGVAASPGNDYVYALGSTDNTLVEFSRDIHTHLISPIHIYQRDMTGVPALSGAKKVAVSDDGKFVLVTGQLDNALVIFQKANPKPTLFTLLPASVAAGSSGITLVIKGTGFAPGAKIMWEAVPLETTYINESEVDGVLPASFLAVATTHMVMVQNPAPGGGLSALAKPFIITTPGENQALTQITPVPTIDYVTPGGVKAGSGSFTLDIYGTNFVATSLVYVNDVNTNVNLRTANHLQVTVDASFVAQAGTLSIMVGNGGTVVSNLIGLNVSPPAANPVPTINSLSPAYWLSLGNNDKSFVITITGQNFVEGALAYWNGSERPTQFVDSAHLRVTISSTDQLFPPTLGSLTVMNPTPGGGLSNLVQYTIYQLYRTFLPNVIQ